MKLRYPGVVVLIVAVALSAVAQSPTRTTDSQTISVSGKSITIDNPKGFATTTFEEIISGAPSTVSIVIQGCMRGGTCDTLDTYTTVANSNRKPTITTAYDNFSITASWTGGTSPSVQVNTTESLAKNPSAGGGIPSVFGRTGAVTAQANDYTCAQVTNCGTAPVNTTGTAQQFFSAYNSTTGAFTKTRPAASDVSGLAASATTDTTLVANVVGAVGGAGAYSVGRPLVASSSTAAVDSLIYLDATQSTGADIAAKADAALATSANNTPVDLEGFNGVQSYTGSATGLFASTRRGWLKLGCQQTLNSSTLPAMVVGTGMRVSGCSADSSTGTNAALNGVNFKYSGSAPGSPSPMICPGDVNGCSAQAGGGSFNAPVEYLSVDAQNVSNVIPVSNNYGQELSDWSFIRVKNFKGAGFNIANPDGTPCTHCQNWVLRSSYAIQQSDACTATTHAYYVNANTFGIELDKSTGAYNSGSGSCTTTAPDSIYRLSALGFLGLNNHAEANGVSLPSGTHAFVVGQDQVSNTVTLINPSVAAMNGGDAFRISNAFSSGNVTIIGAYAGGSGVTNLLNDQVRGVTIPLATRGKIGLYAIGDNGDQSIITTLPVPNNFPSGVVANGQPVPNYVAGAGTAQAQTVSIAAFNSPSTAALSNGLVVRWLPTAANSATAPTLAVNGLTAKTITKCGSQALVANDLLSTVIAEASYDGTQFQLMNPQAGSCGQPFTVVATDTGTANTYVINPVPAIPALAAGAMVVLHPANNSSAASTINVSGLGVKSITKNGTTALGADLLTTNYYLLIYDGTEWIVWGNALGCNTCTRTGGVPVNHQPAIWNSASTIGQTSSTMLFDATNSFWATYNNETLAGVGTAYIRGVTSQKSESAADASVLSVTPASAVGSYRACFTMSVSAASAAVLGWTATWTDSNGNAQTPTNLALSQSGTAAPALTFTTSAAGNYFACQNLDVNAAGTAIVVKLTFSGTSFAAKVSASVERVQ